MKKLFLIAVITVLITSCSKDNNLVSDFETYMPSYLEISVDSEGNISNIKEIESGCVIIDATGQRHEYPNAFVMPGLCDAHGHLSGLGQTLMQPDFKGLLSPEKCIEEAKKYSPNRGEWYYGRGWNHELWETKELPTKELLDIAFPDNPVCFRRVDGHAAWVNSKALEIAGIDANTTAPEGGKILFDKSGEPTGVLIDAACDLVLDIIPDLSDKEVTETIVAGTKELLKYGVTEIGAIDVLLNELPLYLAQYESGNPNLRMQIYLSAHDNQHQRDTTYWFFKNEYLNVRGLKYYADGALGSYGAALLEDYSDMPGHKGVLFFDEEKLYSRLKPAFEKGFDIAIHAIGDSANRMVLNVYQKLAEEYDGNPDDRPLLRVEHAQLLNPDDIERFSKYDIIASMQPVHCTSDAYMAEKRLGLERCRQAGYKWKTLLDAGTKIIAGSDFPIESCNPIIGIDAFVNRRPHPDSAAWFSEETVSLKTAVKCYTLNPRQFLRIENRGLIKAGNQADIIIIDNDLTNADKIRETKVLETFISGKSVYKR